MDEQFDLGEALRPIVEKFMRARMSRIEEAVWASMQDGEHGVLVDDDHGTVGVSVLVPFGEIHFIGTPNAERWL